MPMKQILIPASAPTSPAATRSKTDRHPPVTPQRVSQSVRAVSSSSPYTPATTLSTPYTPFSLRSLSSSSNGSNLATPASAICRRRLSLSLSPEVNTNSKSLADIAENWRTRANENGIKVASGDDSQYQADESSLDISIPAIDKGRSTSAVVEYDLTTFTSIIALLPAPFFATQRRARSFTHVQAPLTQIPDPTQLCTPSRSLRLPSSLETPPPQPAFMLRGSVTDPAHTRRRPPFEQATELFDIDEDEYTPYPPAFSSPLPSQSLPLSLNDPFNLSGDISSMSEPVLYYETPAFCSSPKSKRRVEDAVFVCSVCSAGGGPLAILEPCEHPLCSACLTSALNIVGEKDMECAVCKAKVDNFQLRKPPQGSFGNGLHQTAPHTSAGGRSHGDLRVLDDDGGLLPSAFDGGALRGAGSGEELEDFMDRAQGASTPVAAARGTFDDEEGHLERPVLRIDNVPWDITPPLIAQWLGYPIERVHVLLDRKGKTLSHAYVEMCGTAAAKLALRSAQNSVLGRGKRARGVTVTKSSQEELMRALFPSWQGNFDNSRPSLSGLDNERVISTLQRGLISEAELNSLLHLIRSPDSHFLKVPSLPFHSLISLLSKFPADDDSRVFWSGTLRDSLYDITYTAVNILLERIEENPFSEWAPLISDVVRAALECQAFTSEQMSKLSDILEAALHKVSGAPKRFSSPSLRPAEEELQSQPQPHPEPQNEAKGHSAPGSRAYGDLAIEFGVEPHLIEALARRLSDLREVGKSDSVFSV
ncbi:hypothetical protein POSPLADRAFT_1073992 [Postia placenta MAD-698-R-SB12]|uniref:RING-type domain-containing protein n=1 Tax=Postia placenta MAD-698-R-SB12 TaxID=670580 RepID=A0A1X6N484_9APHY|nr:hypothetical protein POSPLADRAFT_1073992 [Postia placenta MAD-698-R-SB12]OSX63296.1 hypothetical protein POSPLADRAFT_1073992 [Postia placenta MAD-698-R-SB12]